MMTAYALEGPKWGPSQLGTSATVTWAAESSLPAAFLSDIRAAFTDWASQAGLTFKQVASTSGANIKLGEAYIDGLDNVLGETDYTYSGGSFTSAEITFDSGEGWRTSNGQVVSRDGVKLFVLALHEIGHALGLDHYNASPTVMNAYLNPSVTDLTASDIAGIQALYGAPSTLVASVPTPVTPAPTTTASPAASSDTTAVYRFYDTRTGDHFYTTSSNEKAQIQASLPSFNYEGIAWATPAKSAETHDVFRFFDVNTGTHFFTDSTTERDQIVKTIASYHYEGIALQAYNDPSTAGSGADTLERFYNTNTGQHHYAASAEEAYGINHGAAGAGWVDEGHAFTVHTPSAAMLFA